MRGEAIQQKFGRQRPATEAGTVAHPNLQRKRAIGHLRSSLLRWRRTAAFPNPCSPAPADGGYAFEVKWDGFRAIVSMEGLELRPRR
jgi:ATP-dependent DNA ligase